LFLSVEHLFFGVEPVIELGARLIAARDIELVSAAANAFFETKRRDRGFPCACGCRHEITSAMTVS
jgi:hypothetical protein